MAFRLWPSLLLCLVCWLGFAAPPSIAHQQKVAISSVSFNQRSGNLEIYHRFFIHDAEHSIRHLFGKGADILRDATTQQRFADYVVAGFKLQTLSGDDLKPKLLGYEVEGKFFFVYQEVTAIKPVAGLRLLQPALQDIWSQQINTVNVEGRGPVQSLNFSAGAGWQSVKFN